MKFDMCFKKYKEHVIQRWICQNSHPIKKMLSEVVTLVYNHICFQILF